MDSEGDYASQKIEELFEKYQTLHGQSYPSSYIDFDKMNLTSRVKQSQYTIGKGHNADVYKGELDNHLAIGVKVLRLPVYDPLQESLYKSVLLRFFRELHHWHELDHVNIVQLLGFTLSHGNLGFVSLWYRRGNLVQHLQRSPEASRPDLVLDVAEGVLYLHTRPEPLMHGDLKGVNILVTENGIARLADFGISKQISDLNRQTGFSTMSGITGTIPWLAPELLAGAVITLACDIYSFAGVIIEICCPGKFPYHYLSQEAHIMFVKYRRELPDRAHYPEFDDCDTLWGLVTECLANNPQDRYDIDTITQTLYQEYALLPRVDQTSSCRPKLGSGTQSPRDELKGILSTELHDETISVLARAASTLTLEDLDALNSVLPPVESTLQPESISQEEEKTTNGQSLQPEPGSAVDPTALALTSTEHVNDVNQLDNFAESQLEERSDSPGHGLESVVSYSETTNSSDYGDVTMAELVDMDIDDVPDDHKKTGSGWYAIFNPEVNRVLDVNLVMTLSHESVVCAVGFSRDGRYLATGCNITAQIYDTQTGTQTCVLVHETGSRRDLYIRSVCFSPDGRLLATGAEDTRVRVWDIIERKVLQTLEGHTSAVYSLDFPSDGRKIISGSGDGTARIWDLETREFMPLVTIEPATVDVGMTSVAISSDGKHVATGSVDTVIRIWDVDTGNLIERLKGHRDAVYSVAFTPDGKGLVSGSLDKSLKYWNLEPLMRNPKRLRPLTQGRASASGQQPVNRQGGGKGCNCTAEFSGHQDYVLTVGVSPDGAYIISGSKDRGVQFWDPRSSQPEFMLNGHRDSVISIDISPVLTSGGGLLATGSGDWSARIWKYEPSPESDLPGLRSVQDPPTNKGASNMPIGQ